MKEDIRDLILNNVQKDQNFNGGWELYEHLDYDGSVHSLIDSSIDIYYYDLRKWAVDNWVCVEEAMDEGLCEGVTDYHKLIQAGQYVSLSSEAHQYIQELYAELDGVAFNTSEPDESQEEETPKFNRYAHREVLLEGAERDEYIKARFN